VSDNLGTGQDGEAWEGGWTPTRSEEQPWRPRKQGGKSKAGNGGD